MKTTDLLSKISSRKFWVFLGGFISSLLVAFQFSENEIAQIVSIVTSFGAVAVYILAEASVDKAAVKAETLVQTIVVEEKEGEK